MTGVQTCALPICFPVTIAGLSGDIRMNMIIAAALIEGVALLAVVVCLLVFFL